MKHGEYAATGSLLKIYIRSSKVITLLLVFLPFLFAYGAAASNIAVLATPEQLSAYIMQNQGNALLGSIAANTIAGATVWRIRLSSAIIISIFSIVLMIGGTRTDEEEGRLELLRSGAVGMKAPLTAILIKVFGANLLGGFMMALGFMMVGFPAAGSFTAGFAIALCGCCFAAIAGIMAQIAPNARLARGLSFGAVAFFMVCQVAANAVGNENLLLFTPLGWCAYSGAFSDENYLLFLFAILVIALITFITYILLKRRDMGGSYFREKSGRTAAAQSFKSPFALAWRLQRSMLFVWIAAYALMGMIIGLLTPNIEKMLEGTAFLPELSAAVGGEGRAFLAILSYILTQVVTAYAIMAILRIREEEAFMRAEVILSGPVSRVRYAAGHLLISFAGSGAAIGFFGILTDNFASCIVRLPAVWVVASVVVLLYGIAPRAVAPAGWGLFGVLLVLEFLWEIRAVSSNIFKLSPFAWVYPGVAVSAISIITMLAITVILTILGLFCFSRRDIEAE